MIIKPPIEFIDTNEKTRSDIIEEIFQLSAVRPQSGDGDSASAALLAQLSALREREDEVRTDILRVTAALHQMEECLISRAPYHVIDKFRVQTSDIEKIVRLILSLTSRLVALNNLLQSVPATREERDRLETKRGKLRDQLEETKSLWQNIDKRTSAVKR